MGTKDKRFVILFQHLVLYMDPGIQLKLSSNTPLERSISSCVIDIFKLFVAVLKPKLL